MFESSFLGVLKEIRDKISGTVGTGGSVGNGLTAYELALANGFIGTVQEWLNSLKGQKGDNGVCFPVDSTISFSLDENGDLYIYYNDGTIIPSFEIVDGVLYQITEDV